MRTLRILSLLLIAGVLFSCQKDVEPTETLREASFGITKVDPVVQKDGDQNLPQCSELEPAYAQITITGVGVLEPKVFYLGDTLYTQSVKLEPGQYEVTNFLIFSEDGTLIMAVPMSGSDFADYVIEPVTFDFTVDAFAKNDFEVEVLCFEPEYYTDFGFTWFAIGEVVARNLCFFGDICVKNWETYSESLYADAPDGLQLDMSAIMKIVVTWPDGTIKEFYNVTGTDYSTDMPLCITYPDRLLIPNETFQVDLYVLLNQGDGFGYELMGEYTVTDDGSLMDGTEEIVDLDEDGIYDFVVGTCNYDPADIEFAPWQVLPEYANVTIAHNYATGGYWTLEVNFVYPELATSYDFPTSGTYLGWCGDEGTTITQSTHDLYLHSSMNDVNWPDNTPVTLESLAKINWLFNNLETYGYPAISGMFITPWTSLIYTGTPQDLQVAVWEILDPGSQTLNGFSNAMVTDAYQYVVDNGGDDFLPLPGEFAAVLMLKNDNPEDYQLIFTMVDP